MLMLKISSHPKNIKFHKKIPIRQTEKGLSELGTAMQDQYIWRERDKDFHTLNDLFKPFTFFSVFMNCGSDRLGL